MQTIKPQKKLAGKDLITVGIFTAIYFVISLVVMVLGGLHPVVWILMPAIIALVGAVPFMIMTAKLMKPFAVLLMGIICGLLYFATGQFAVTLPIAFLVGSLLAEFVRFLFKYNHFWANALGFAFFSFGMAGSPLPLWIYRENFFQKIRDVGMPAEYIRVLEGFTSPVMLVVMVGATFCLAFAGALVAKLLFVKHFEKGGMV